MNETRRDIIAGMNDRLKRLQSAVRGGHVIASHSGVAYIRNDDGSFRRGCILEAERFDTASAARRSMQRYRPPAEFNVRDRNNAIDKQIDSLQSHIHRMTKEEA